MYKQFNFPNSQFVNLGEDNYSSINTIIYALKQEMILPLEFKAGQENLEGTFLTFFSQNQQKEMTLTKNKTYKKMPPLLAIIKGEFSKAGKQHLTLKPINKENGFESCYGYLHDKNQYILTQLIRKSCYWDINNKAHRFYKIENKDHIWRID
jgi:hypothetical protein